MQSAIDAVENMPTVTAAKLEAMSERLEEEITQAVKTILGRALLPELPDHC